jgi:hypothetical protein
VAVEEDGPSCGAAPAADDSEATAGDAGGWQANDDHRRRDTLFMLHRLQVGSSSGNSCLGTCSHPPGRVI